MSDQDISRALHLGVLLGTLELRYLYSNVSDDDQSDIVQMLSMAKSLLNTLGLSEYTNRDKLGSDIWKNLQSELWAKYGDKVRIALQVGLRFPSICKLDSVDYPKASQLFNETKESFLQIGLPEEEYDRLISKFFTKSMGPTSRMAEFQRILDKYFKLEQDRSKIGGNVINIGNGNRVIITINSTLHNASQTIADSQGLDPAIKDELTLLLEQLNLELQQATEINLEEAEAVAEFAKVLVETTTKDKPNKAVVKINAEGLKAAAQNIASVMPTILTISTQIIKTIFQFLAIPIPS